MSNRQSAVNLEDFCKRVDKERYLEIGESLVESNVGKSFSLLSFGLSVNSSRRKEYYKLYLNVVENWINKLLELSRFQDVLKIFEVAQDIYSESPDLDYLLACTLYRIGKFREAWQYSLKTLNACKHDPKARDLASSLSSLLVDRWHFPMINDYHRNKVYKDSIQKLVDRGHASILDIGAGSSLLSIYAKQAGCRKIYACEVDEYVCELGEEVLKLNDADAYITLLNRHSKDLKIPADIPERVSMVITEIFDSGLFGEHVLQTLKHAWNQLLLPLQINNTEGNKNFTRILPSRTKVWAAVIECDYVARQAKLNNSEILNGACVHLELNEPYLSEKINNVPGRFKLLTEWKQVLHIDFNSLSEIDNLLSGKVVKTFGLAVTTEGRGDGIIIAYNLYLDADNYITTFPEYESCWENAIYPIYSSSILPKDAELTITLMCDDVLHFKLSNDFTSSALTTTDIQFIKCANSSSYLEFYKAAAELYFQEHSQAAVTALDTCPFPQGGITISKLGSKNKVFVNENIYSIIKASHIEVHSAASRKGQVDVAFYWPFTAEGTLKDNILEDLRYYRKLVSKNGKVYPERLDLQMLGIESDAVARMTTVNDVNTVGVKIAEVFNLTKTLHHLDVPIEGINYCPITPVLNPVQLDLSEGTIILRGQEIREELYKQFLIVGDSLSRSFLPFQTISKGKINGFVYWFELTNCERTFESESSGSDCDVGLKTFEVKTLQKGLLSKYLHGSDSPAFNSFSRDSPINQCILLLDEPFIVRDIQCLNLNVAMSGSHFSVDVIA